MRAHGNDITIDTLGAGDAWRVSPEQAQAARRVIAGRVGHARHQGGVFTDRDAREVMAALGLASEAGS